MHEVIFRTRKMIWKAGNVRVGMKIKVDKMTSLGEDQESKRARHFETLK